jgi:hypothetical protein
VEVLRRFRVGNLHAMLQFGSMPRQTAMDNISLFASDVLPRLHGVWSDEQWEHHWWPERLGGRLLPEPAPADLVGGTR